MPERRSDWTVSFQRMNQRPALGIGNWVAWRIGSELDKEEGTSFLSVQR